MPSSAALDEQVVVYVKRVRDLYANVRDWLAGATIHESETEVSEGSLATYVVPVLTVRRPSGLPVEFIPKGYRIIGGHGRVDLASRTGSETIVYVRAGGPQLSIRERISEDTREDTRATGSVSPLFPGIDRDGWVWVEQRLPGKARMLSSEVLARVLDLLDQ